MPKSMLINFIKNGAVVKKFDNINKWGLGLTFQF